MFATHPSHFLSQGNRGLFTCLTLRMGHWSIHLAQPRHWHIIATICHQYSNTPQSEIVFMIAEWCHGLLVQYSH